MDRQCRILLAIMLASAILFLLPFFYKVEKQPPPTFAWAPGYWQVIPEVGMARITPLSRATLIAPAAGMALRSLRQAPALLTRPAYRKLPELRTYR